MTERKEMTTNEKNVIEANTLLVDKIKEVKFDNKILEERIKLIQKRLLDYVRTNDDVKEIIEDCLLISKGKEYGKRK